MRGSLFVLRGEGNKWGEGDKLRVAKAACPPRAPPVGRRCRENIITGERISVI
jgi:hypothetical protein